jgi:transposase
MVHTLVMDARDKRIRELEALLEKAFARIAELERMLGLNSKNSSKPPSSDGLRKKPSPQSLRPKGQNPSGGQKGHKGHTLDQVSDPSHIKVHTVKTCESCEASLSEVLPINPIRRQVFDIPEPRIEVTEHQAEVKYCLCGHVTTAEFPVEVRGPVQYGSRVKTFAIYLSVQQMIPEDRLQTLFQDVFCLPISTATLVNLNAAFSQRITSAMEGVLARLKVSEVKHADESGIRIGGKTQWLHTAQSF